MIGLKILSLILQSSPPNQVESRIEDILTIKVNSLTFLLRSGRVCHVLCEEVYHWPLETF